MMFFNSKKLKRKKDVIDKTHLIVLPINLM